MRRRSPAAGTRPPTRSFLVTLVLLALAACSAANERVGRRADGRLRAETTAPAPGLAADIPTKLPHDLGSGGWDDTIVDNGTLAVRKSPKADANQPASAERLLIYRGQVRVEVAKPDDVIATFRAQVVAWGGHLQQQSDRTLVVRVPASRFEEAFAWVRSQGRVLGESRRTDDVTEEFIDLGIRLDTARKARDRLLEVLQKADKIEDVLKVEAELRRLTEEIERMEGRQKLLADQVALATLEATFQPIADVPMAKRTRQPSRFGWINAVGAERLMEDF